MNLSVSMVFVLSVEDIAHSLLLITDSTESAGSSSGHLMQSLSLDVASLSSFILEEYFHII